MIESVLMYNHRLINILSFRCKYQDFKKIDLICMILKESKG